MRQQELEQVAKTHKTRGGGGSGNERETQKAEEYKQEDAVLERDVMQATASEKLALERVRGEREKKWKMHSRMRADVHINAKNDVQILVRICDCRCGTRKQTLQQ
jgi:hypothetical protein